jgi:hypothetical protein
MARSPDPAPPPRDMKALVTSRFGALGRIHRPNV